MKHKTLLFIAALLLTFCLSVQSTEDIEAGIKTINATWTYFEVKPNQVFTVKLDTVKANKLKWRSDSSSLKILKGGKFKIVDDNGFGFLTTEYKGIEYNIMICAYKDGGKSCAQLHGDYRELQKEYKALEKKYYDLYDEWWDLYQKSLND